MQAPDVVTTLRDAEHRVTYHVYAYRQLEREEVLEAIRAYHSQKKNRRRKKPLRNAVISIITLIGAV